MTFRYIGDISRITIRRWIQSMGASVSSTITGDNCRVEKLNTSMGPLQKSITICSSPSAGCDAAHSGNFHAKSQAHRSGQFRMISNPVGALFQGGRGSASAPLRALRRANQTKAQDGDLLFEQLPRKSEQSASGTSATGSAHRSRRPTIPRMRGKQVRLRRTSAQRTKAARPRSSAALLRPRAASDCEGWETIELGISRFSKEARCVPGGRIHPVHPSSSGSCNPSTSKSVWPAIPARAP